MTDLPNKALLRPDEVADYFSVTRKTIYVWVDEEILEGKKIGGVLRITRESVIRAQNREVNEDGF